MTKTMDEMRCSVVALKPPFDFEENDSQQEMSLTKAIAMSRIHCRIPPIPPKVKSNNKESSSSSTFVRFAQALTRIHEYESHHETFKDQIWYSPNDFGEMIEDLDETTKRRKRHIAGIRKCYIHTILDLQGRHRLEGIHDPKGLACMAKRCTKFSCRDAARRGKELELELLVSSATTTSSSERNDQHQLQQADEEQEPPGTLDILKSVLGIMGEMDATSYKKQDTSLQPPIRLLSPRQQDEICS